VLETFMREVVGMDDPGMARFRADAVWPLRVAASPTILRELEAEGLPDASLDALGHVAAPVLQILGTATAPAFRAATIALAERLPHGSIARIEGAAHAAHHTHPEDFVATVERFLDAPDDDLGRSEAPGDRGP
jgi:pimeloyl-ACP methyl ester carboxylesterase